MGAIQAIIANLVMSKVEGNAKGLLASKTAGFASGGLLVALAPLMAGIMEKDPTAIGNAVILVFLWAGTLWARLKAKS